MNSESNKLLGQMQNMRYVRVVRCERQLVKLLPKYPFKVIENEDMLEFVVSIRNRDVLTPTIVIKGIS